MSLHGYGCFSFCRAEMIIWLVRSAVGMQFSPDPRSAPANKHGHEEFVSACAAAHEPPTATLVGHLLLPSACRTRSAFRRRICTVQTSWLCSLQVMACPSDKHLVYHHNGPAVFMDAARHRLLQVRPRSK